MDELARLEEQAARSGMRIALDRFDGHWRARIPLDGRRRGSCFRAARPLDPIGLRQSEDSRSSQLTVTKAND